VKHLEAVEKVLDELDSVNASYAENLRGLARAWDRIEITGESIASISNISNQMLRVMVAIGVEDTEDVFLEMLKDFNG
jgi:hypothetical protein